MERADKCISCGTRIVGEGHTSFNCPGCGKAVIGRCKNCRNQSVSYNCLECGFSGP